MTVDIVVPVYRDLACARRCLGSLLACPPGAQREIIVIDDASPEAEVSAYLDRLAAAGHVTLLRNAGNLGFVASVNRGMALHPERDVVLLNSDTEVANDWLDRLLRALRSAPDIGTATPFSNNATICSYPYEDWHDDLPGGLGLSQLDTLIASVNPAMTADLPTAVGFCMAIRRACLTETGAFDAARFPRGYGEENDFCRRAATLGWRHVLAADIFVYHQGSASFGAERHALMRAAWETIQDLHPDYPELVRDFIARDPLAPLRWRIDRARARHSAAEAAHVAEEQARRPAAGRGRPGMLHVLHGWGGGVARWTDDFRRHDPTHRHLLLYSQGDRDVFGRGCVLIDPDHPETPLAVWTHAEPIRATAVTHLGYAALLDDIIAGFDVRAVVVSSLIGHSLDVLSTGLATLRVVHDLYPYCPAMFGFHGQACAICGPAELDACLRGNPLNECWHNSTRADWLMLRPAYAASLRRVEVRLAAPSRDAWHRLRTLFPEIADLSCAIVPHGIDVERLGPPLAPRVDARHGPLRVVVPGRLEAHKGLRLLREVIPTLNGRVDFLLLGRGGFANAFAGLANARGIADYDLADLGRLIRDYQPDCALLLSLLPETFSYTLSEMSALGVPSLATRLGAFAERIEDGVDGLLVEPDAGALGALLGALAADARPLAAIAARLRATPPRHATAMVSALRELLPDRDTPYLRGHLEQGIAQAQGDLRAHQEAERQTWRARVEDQGRDIATLRMEIDALRASHSWRLSAPLRHLARAWRRRFATPVTSSDVAETSATETGAYPGLRGQLDIPEAARLVVVACASLSPEALVRLARAVELCATRRDVYFLWLEPAGSLAEPEAELATAMAFAPRRLARRPDTPALRAALGEADLICQSAATDAPCPVLDPGAVADMATAIDARLRRADGA